MSFAATTELRSNEFYYRGLAAVVRQLENFATEMGADDLQVEAASLVTTIGDLQWQQEELISGVASRRPLDFS
jgi:hypothetical protein